MTLLDLLQLLIAGALAVTATALGLKLGCRVGDGGSAWAIAGSIIGAFVGSLVGLRLGALPKIWMLESIARELAPKTAGELRALLHDERYRYKQCLLLELRNRGEDIQPELAFVLDMMVSDSEQRRRLGWTALRSAFPDVAARLNGFRGYSPADPVEACRAQVARLEQSV